MNNLFNTAIKSKLNKLRNESILDARVLENALKEELQLYVLDYIYHHSDYSDWTMYGGSVLRICHELDRMSIDLDFEISQEVSENLLNSLKEGLETFFNDTYGVSSNALTIKITNKRGLTLKFNLGDDLGIKFGARKSSANIYIKIDLNNFSMGEKTATEKIPINHDQFSFFIKTYNMSSLMASKIAAVFNRGSRGVGDKIYKHKGRDIYDLLWYMDKRILPDIDYLQAKEINVKNLKELFDKLTLEMNKVDEKNLQDDLTPLFKNRSKINGWLSDWLNRFFSLKKSYKIVTVTKLDSIFIVQDPDTDVFSFTYRYDTEESIPVKIKYELSGDDYLPDLNTPIDEKVIKLISNKKTVSDKEKRYATLFEGKNKAYFKKTNNVTMGDIISTKLIRTTAHNLKYNEQIVLDESTLRNCELEDLLK